MAAYTFFNSNLSKCSCFPLIVFLFYFSLIKKLLVISYFCILPVLQLDSLSYKKICGN